MPAPDMRQGWADVAGWGTLALVALLGWGGAAAAPEGVLLGVPSAGGIALVAVGLALLVVAGGRPGVRACLGLVSVPLLLFSGLSVPGLRALSGPPLLGLAAAGVVLAMAERHPALSRRLFFPAVLLLYTATASRVQSQVGPEGDEPHYLMVADSLLRDGDISLERDYAEGRYRTFHPADLAPHYRVRGRQGEVYSLHALGLSLLVLPAYGLGGYPAASLFMALVAALLAREIRGLLRDALGAGGIAEGTSWAVALSPPLVHYAGLIFTEVPAALIVAFALRRGRTVERARGAILLGATIAFLPWLNVRYSLLAVILFLYAISRGLRARDVAALGAPAALSAVLLGLYHFALYGFLDPRRVYGARPELALAHLPEGLQGLLLDQEFGLLMYAPAFALAGPGLLRLLRGRSRLAVTGLAMVVVVLLTAGAWPMWRGGFNPPARFLVPLVPVLALGLAAWLGRGVSAAAALLIGWGLWTGLAGAAEPRLVHRDRDGTAPFFRSRSGAEEWTRLLPAYVLSEPDRHRLAIVWAVALLLAPWQRRRSAMAAAVTVVGFGVATAAASALSDARTAGRDAVRLVGRRALEVPAWRLVRSATCSWDTRDLDWGPLYEPHRFPDGAELGRRLALPPGAYRLELQGDELAPGQASPRLDVVGEAGASPRTAALGRIDGGLVAFFRVRGSERAVTLRIREGGPWIIRRINLLAAPGSNSSGVGVSGQGASHEEASPGSDWSSRDRRGGGGRQAWPRAAAGGGGAWTERRETQGATGALRRPGRAAPLDVGGAGEDADPAPGGPGDRPPRVAPPSRGAHAGREGRRRQGQGAG